MQRKKLLCGLTTLLFAVGVALFFTRAASLPFKVAYPVALLAASAFLSRRPELLPFGAAFLLSALGDAMGAKHLFIPQMLFFALAHGAYLCYFLPRSERRPRRFSLLFLVPLLLFLFVAVVPRVADSAEQAGVAVYGVVIAAMLYGVLQYDGPSAAGFRCAALLFVFSDSVIAWNRFIGPVPEPTLVIMVTYYLAQWLFYLFALRAAASRPAAES